MHQFLVDPSLAFHHQSLEGDDNPRCRKQLPLNWEKKSRDASTFLTELFSSDFLLCEKKVKLFAEKSFVRARYQICSRLGLKVTWPTKVDVKASCKLQSGHLKFWRVISAIAQKGQFLISCRFPELKMVPWCNVSMLQHIAGISNSFLQGKCFFFFSMKYVFNLR